MFICNYHQPEKYVYWMWGQHQPEPELSLSQEQSTDKEANYGSG